MTTKPEDRYSAIRNIPPRTANGPIVIKATCGEEIRRIPIVNQVDPPFKKRRRRRGGRTGERLDVNPNTRSAR